jgi:hypothetical protein
MKAIGVGNGTGLTFKLPGTATNKPQPLREEVFAGLPMDALADAVGATADEIVGALLAEDARIVMLFIDTALQNGDIAGARRIVGKSLTFITALAGHHVVMLADRIRLELEPDAARQFIASAAWADTIRALAESTTPSASKDDGRLVFTATLMPRETAPAFVETLAPLSAGLSRAAKDFADLVLALPPRSHS